MSTILITGANKGLGRETARRLLADGHDVWAAARDPQLGRVAAEQLGARPLVLDVTDDASVQAAAETVAAATGGALDVLINNAGISGGAVPIDEVTADHVRPGYTATDLNAHRGTQTVTEGTDAIVAMASIGPDGPTATFVSRDGPVPW
jgi:NAD(P)-dependent dehydrogenase (short-subunit alcohol dehydrogenase family)